MIQLKNSQQIALMKKANQIVKDTLNLLIENTKVGISTLELNKIAHKYILSQYAKPSFLHYKGFPMSVCISIDSEVVHGIPDKKRFLEEGQVVSYDVGAILDGWHGDAARTVGVGIISDQNQKLIDVTEQSFFKGVEAIVPNVSRLGDVGYAIQTYAESFGFGVVRELVGHGIGRNLHEEPDVPNYGKIGFGKRLLVGMTIAIEPMITIGSEKVEFLPSGVVKTLDRKVSAHYENTIAITENGVEILSL